MLSLTKIDNRAVTVKSLTTDAYNSLSNADSILHYGKIYAPALFESDQKTHLLKKFKHAVKLIVGNTTATFEVLHGETLDSSIVNAFRNVVSNLDDDEALSVTYKSYNKQLNSLVTTPIVAINYANRSNTSSICALISSLIALCAFSKRTCSSNFFIYSSIYKKPPCYCVSKFSSTFCSFAIL